MLIISSVQNEKKENTLWWIFHEAKFSIYSGIVLFLLLELKCLVLYEMMIMKDRCVLMSLIEKKLTKLTLIDGSTIRFSFSFPSIKKICHNVKLEKIKLFNLYKSVLKGNIYWRENVTLWENFCISTFKLWFIERLV